jgi:hypothetical protein
MKNKIMHQKCITTTRANKDDVCLIANSHVTYSLLVFSDESQLNVSIFKSDNNLLLSCTIANGVDAHKCVIPVDDTLTLVLRDLEGPLFCLITFSTLETDIHLFDHERSFWVHNDENFLQK